MHYKDKFFEWLDKILGENDFDNVDAFNFNLYETSDEFHLQLIGARCFDIDNDDWACDEVFTTGENYFIILKSISGFERLHGLDYSSKLINAYLYCGKFSSKLEEKKVVGIGFIDGDIDILYQEKL